jgi:molybdopterin-synthase adenylyltransferase
MGEFRLKIAASDFEHLRALLFADLPREAAAFALAGAADHTSGSDVVVRRVVEVPNVHFWVQHEYRLEVAPQAINGLIALCERNGLGAILCHSHPSDMPYSLSDDHGERRVFETLRKFIPQSAPTASLLFFPGGVRGRVWLQGAHHPIALSEIVVLGSRIERIRPQDDSTTAPRAISSNYERQVRAFGADGQAAISRAKVAIVGLGGTGSPTAEQLVRLGVNDLVLIDPDRLDPTNLTRVYGTFSSSLQRRWWKPRRREYPLKVEEIAGHLKKIRPGLRIKAVPHNVALREAAVSVLDRDMVFLCTDEHWGRSIVNQIAYQYFIPTVNLGVRIAAEDGRIAGASGAVDVLQPDNPCLWCSQFLRADRIAAESMPQSARRALEREGYVEGIDAQTPSVVSLTTTLSGMAVTLFLQLTTGFMGDAGDIARLNYNIMEGTVRRGRALISDQCLCKKVRGSGDLKPLPVLRDLSFLEK